MMDARLALPVASSHQFFLYGQISLKSLPPIRVHRTTTTGPEKKTNLTSFFILKYFMIFKIWIKNILISIKLARICNLESHGLIRWCLSRGHAYTESSTG